MSVKESNLISPLAAPQPPPPSGEVLTAEQWITMLALGDALIPAVEEASLSTNNDKESLDRESYRTLVQSIEDAQLPRKNAKLVRSYLAESASNVPKIKESVHRTISQYVPGEARQGIRTVLSALNTRAGCLLLTKSPTLFHKQPLRARQQILRAWERSYLPPLRSAYKSFTVLFKATWILNSPTMHEIIGIPRAPVHGTPGKGFDFNFMHFFAGDTPETIETDVVVVGSGCGGGVCAKNMSEAGYRTIVVERAYHYPPQYLPMSPPDAAMHLYRSGGADFSDDGSIAMLSGQSWGGGGTINWSASLQPQHFVRREWASDELPLFTSEDFQTSLDRVCARMGVSADHVAHNHTNRVLLEGARRLGYNAQAVPQNTGGRQHYCGYCSFGCGSAEKQGPVVSFLPDAARAGAKFIEGFEAEKVLFEMIDGRRTAVGLQGTWRAREGGAGEAERVTRSVIIKARRVILSAGSLQSPIILLRSGLDSPPIGRNLHLHPVGSVFGVFDHRTNPWEGGILTSVVDSLQNLDGKGHGTKLEALFMMPGTGLPFAPWFDGAAFKALAAKFGHMTGMISLARDRDTGRVYLGADGSTRIAYTPSAHDRAHVLEGMLALAEVLQMAGAREIHPCVAGAKPFVRQDPPRGARRPGDYDDETWPTGVNEPRFREWLNGLRAKGMGESVLGSAHQMGSCRMGSSARDSVVDPRGRVWDTEKLYVADASVFPSASGVNPMVTNMAIADWISRGIASVLGDER